MSDTSRKNHIYRLKAVLKCFENQTSSTCNCSDCDNCEWNYASGNMGEIKETLAFAIASLETDEAYQLMEEQPEFCEGCISRKAAIAKFIDKTPNGHLEPINENESSWSLQGIVSELTYLPSVLPKTVNMNYPPESESAYEKALLKAYADGQASVESKWIPVSERLPEESYNSVLGWDAYRERCVLVQYLDGRFQIMGKTESFDIRAWMPLPEPFEPQKSGGKE